MRRPPSWAPRWASGLNSWCKDLLSGFFIIVEKQYGFGDLVSLTVTGIAAEARGTVENVTLRVTRLRSPDGELFTIPNGSIVKAVNLSKDWARAVVDIPVADQRRPGSGERSVARGVRPRDGRPTAG